MSKLIRFRPLTLISWKIFIWRVSNESEDTKPRTAEKGEQTSRKRATAFALAGLMATSGISLPAGTFAYGAENNTLLAFAGAEGGGRFATGGRGYDVYVVTTLEDYGKGETPVEGSLRYGIEEFAKDKGGTMIVFNVGGTIELKQTLTFKERKILP